MRKRSSEFFLVMLFLLLSIWLSSLASLTTSVFVKSFSLSGVILPPSYLSSSSTNKKKQVPQSRTRTTTSIFGRGSSSSAATLEVVQEEEDQTHQDISMVSFSHVHLYVDHLDDLNVYKTLENQLNEFDDRQQESLSSSPPSPSSSTLEKQRILWKSIVSSSDPSSSSPVETFVPHGRDVVKQLLAGLGFRITAASMGYDDAAATSSTQSVLVTSRDIDGVQILITAAMANKTNKNNNENNTNRQPKSIFDSENIDEFYHAHNNRQGIAVLGFLVNNIDSIRTRYGDKHPNLIAREYNSNSNNNENDTRILEVYAFYDKDNKQFPDKGTILRFVQKPTVAHDNDNNDGNDSEHFLLPGLVPVEAKFDSTCQAAYCDHWVSNVFSRTDFLDILSDTLNFSPKVDFNAGVVAAGEAQIESTVTGNDAVLRTQDKKRALQDQSQVYLPINNALSEVGHVHGFLQELGQGIQHLASRVDNLVDFVQRGNDNRKITGEGFTFLRIPRSYYGILTAAQLAGQDDDDDDDDDDGGGGLSGGDSSANVSIDCANSILAALKTAGAVAKDGAVDLDLTRDGIDKILESNLAKEALEEYRSSKTGVVDVIARSRYKNLYGLLRGNLSEESYLAIVRNQILVDIQGDDLLYQIFTANILQRKPGDEAPFFEFIQRVCSECLDEDGCPQKIRPGCGGFGIRNFLTLFLSIEVSKAMQEVSDSEAAGDTGRALYAEAMVDAFTSQLNESNPILTEISDAMTEEGRCKERLSAMLKANDVEEAAIWKEKMDAAATRKQLGNEDLMACSSRYNSLMKSLREERNTSIGKGSI